MKTVLISLIFFIVLFVAVFADQKKSYELTITVNGIEEIKGLISLGLYNNETDWTEDDRVYRGAKIPITTTTITYTFKNLPSGTYAVALYHDENSNEKLDTGFFKIPKEGYAFSNNVFGSFGPPDFSEASFFLNRNQNIQILLKN